MMNDTEKREFLESIDGKNDSTGFSGCDFFAEEIMKRLFEEWRILFIQKLKEDSFFRFQVVENMFYSEDSFYNSSCSNFMREITDSVVDELELRVRDNIVDEVIKKMISSEKDSVRTEVSDKIYEELKADKSIKEYIAEDVASFLLCDKEELKERVENQMLKMRTYRSDLLDLDESTY